MLATMLREPTIDLVLQECAAFDNDPFTELSEKALEELRLRFPRNTEVSHILLKVIVLNQLYSTRINYVDLVPFALHITGLGIDETIERGSPSAVDQIWNCEGMRNYYSFATKFCSWHHPAAYPIYDHYVDECLWAYKKQDQFFDFHRQDLYDYEKLVKIVTTFREHYRLGNFSFRQIDKFLWQTGYKILSERSADL
jgi:hypothetical protein